MIRNPNDEIAKFLERIANDLDKATQVMSDSYGTLRPERIFKAQYLLGKIAGELEVMANRLRDTDALSAREVNRMLQREREYRDDEDYFRRLANQRAGLDAKPQPIPASNPSEGAKKNEHD